uniref:Uncharacterized protein n=1 Tax=Myotis myotis TaxID=51298 RepID=A0A7J8ANG8_MYOMY|nr:hypothetical protein mMyoMyo1_008200 [Myotis myotis]
MITETQAKASRAGGKFQDKTRIRFMLEKMLVLKDNDMQRVLGYDPEPVEKLRKLQRALAVDWWSSGVLMYELFTVNGEKNFGVSMGHELLAEPFRMQAMELFGMGGMETVECLVRSGWAWSRWVRSRLCVESVGAESVCEESVDVESVDVESVRAESDRGHIPQQLLKELLGDSMALEAEQVQRMNQPAHLSWEMEQQSEASSRIAQELQGASFALQESSIEYTELKEENQQLRKEMEELRLQLLQEKDTNQEWETFTEELVKELEQLRHEVDTLKADRALQMLELEWQLQKEKDNSQNLENINKELLKDLKQVLDAVDTLQVKAPQLDPSLLASKNQEAAKEREWEELYELLEQLIQVHEALRQDHACLGALHDQLSGQYQALVEEHSRHKTLLRPSLEMASKAFRRREEGKQEGEGTVLDAYESKDTAPRSELT